MTVISARITELREYHSIMYIVTRGDRLSVADLTNQVDTRPDGHYDMRPSRITTDKYHNLDITIASFDVNRSTFDEDIREK